MNSVKEYSIYCWHCGAEFNAFEAPFCSHSDSTKICPFCLNCFCDASKKYKDNFIKGSPKELLEEKIAFQEGRGPKLGEMLIKAGKITEQQLKEAIEQQKIVNRQLGEILLMMGLVSFEELNVFLANQKEIDEIDLEKEMFLIDFSLVEKLGKAFCLAYKMIPIEYLQIGNEKILRFVIPAKDDLVKIKLCPKLKAYTLIPYVTKKEKIEKLLEKIEKWESGKLNA